MASLKTRADKERSLKNLELTFQPNLSTYDRNNDLELMPERGKPHFRLLDPKESFVAETLT